MVGHLSSPPFLVQQCVLEAMILSVASEVFPLLCYFHCCLFFCRGADAQAHSLVRCCLCLSWLLSQGLPSSLPIRARGREGFASALGHSPGGTAAPGRAQCSPQTPRTKQCLLLGSRCILLLPVPRLLCFCHWGRARQLFAL